MNSSVSHQPAHSIATIYQRESAIFVAIGSVIGTVISTAIAFGSCELDRLAAKINEDRPYERVHL